MKLADLVEDILLDCQASVRPWQPQQMRRPESVSLEQVEKIAEQLEHMHLFEKDPHEPGYRLTTQGRLLLNDDRALRRFRRDLNESGKTREPAWELPPDPTPQQKIIFDTLHTRPRPIASRIVIGLNVAVFALGMVLAGSEAGDFLVGKPTEALTKTGGLSFDTLRREGDLGWARLLTCCFVHIGVLHIGMNMYALNILGRDVEWLWGRGRFLVIYFLGGLGGSCLAVFWYTLPQGGVGRPGLFAGASGAICGLLAAEAVWLWGNRAVLPQRLVQSQLKALGINGIIIVVMSLLPGISGAGHFGGALGGAAAAYLLHLHRFGKPPLRGACVAVLAALPVLMILPLRPWSPDAPARMVDPRKADLRAAQLYEGPGEGKGLRAVLPQPPDKRDPAEVARLQAELPPVIDELKQAARQLEAPAGAPEGVSDEDRKAGQEYFTRWAGILEEMGEALRDNRTWGNKEQAARLKAVDGSRPKWIDGK